MKSELKKLDSTKRELDIEITGDVVKNKFAEVFKKIGEKAKVPGFRPGHVPADILEKHFSGEAHQQVLNELVPELYSKAVEKEGLDVLEMPQILDVKLDRTSLSFKAQVEVMPDIDVKNYKGLKIEYKSTDVSSDEIKRSIDSLKEQKKVEVVDDNFARQLGYPSVAVLEKSIERQLAMQKENQERQRCENQILDQLTKGLDFKLPKVMVDKQLQDLVRRAKVELAMRGATKEQVAEQENKLSEQLDPEAKNQVKVYLVLAAIAKKENIVVDDHMPAHVMEFLFKIAEWKTA